MSQIFEDEIYSIIQSCRLMPPGTFVCTVKGVTTLHFPNAETSNKLNRGWKALEGARQTHIVTCTPSWKSNSPHSANSANSANSYLIEQKPGHYASLFGVKCLYEGYLLLRYRVLAWSSPEMSANVARTYNSTLIILCICQPSLGFLHKAICRLKASFEQFCGHSESVRNCEYGGARFAMRRTTRMVDFISNASLDRRYDNDRLLFL